MKVPVIKVRDKYSKTERLVGTDHHDKLIINKDGQLHYVNWQCMDGTGSDEGYGYEFVGYPVQEDEFLIEMHVEFMEVEDYVKLIRSLDAEEKELNEQMDKMFGKGNWLT